MEITVMKTKAFKEWLGGFDELTSRQRQALLSQLEPAAIQKTVTVELENSIQSDCPYCHSQKIGRWGYQSGLQRLRCRDCGKCFNSLTGTPLARLRHKDCWLNYSQALIDGQSVRKAALKCGVNKTTSFRWRHRFLKCPANLKPSTLTGIVEADETYFPLSFKGSRELPRSAYHRGHESHQRGTGEDKVPVLILRDRHGVTTDFKLKVACQDEEAPIVRTVVASDAVLCTDGSRSLKGAAHQIGIAHRALNLSKGVRVLAGVYHLQNVNAYDSRLKNWIRRFNGVATEYLENYLGWRRELEYFGEKISPAAVLHATIGRSLQFNY
jgi:transposase-like protein